MKKFKDKLDTAVFTTKFVIWENSPILSVFHDDDGSWQFIGIEDTQTEDGRIVGLFEIINRDPTVLEVADLPYNWVAYREKVGSTWIRMVQTNQEE